MYNYVMAARDLKLVLGTSGLCYGWELDSQWIILLVNNRIINPAEIQH